MLDTELKQRIQQAYSSFLTNKKLSPRYGQKLMIAEIARTLGTIKQDDEGVRTSEPAVAVIEAGTGTGKTVAYALAAIPLAQAADKTLVISTATIALQEQIVQKDLPDILKHSDLSFRLALAKGRSRYVCLAKLDNLLQVGGDDQNTLQLFDLPAQVTSDETSLKLYTRMVEQLASSRWDGDRDSWPEAIEDSQWRQATTDHGQCTGRRCSSFKQCAFFQAREALAKTDVIVANHDLVLSDLALGGGAILPAPKECIYVFDEGHHLPTKSINHFSHFSRLKASSGWLEQSGKSIRRMLSQHQWPGELGRLLENLEPALLQLADDQLLAFNTLDSLATFDLDAKTSQSRPVWRFANGLVPEPVQELAQQLKAGFNKVTEQLGRVCDELKEAMDGERSSIPAWDAEALYPQLGMMLARAEANSQLWCCYSQADKPGEPPLARWLTQFEQDGVFDIEVASAPILAAPTLREHLWYDAYGVVVTSATLTALGQFERYRMQAGIPKEANCKIVPCPFDHNQAGILAIPALKADPRRAEEHSAELVERLPELLSQASGTLVLFASRKQMRDVYFGLEYDQRQHILLQDDYSKQALLDKHRSQIDEGESSVIFGLASMAEGVDLPGRYCEHVIIAKLPFAVPDDPVEAALAEWIEQRGGNPFMEVTVPDAATKLVQACGRLLRTEVDLGRITVLDRRLVTQRYGKVMLNSLPPFRQEIAR